MPAAADAAGAAALWRKLSAAYGAQAEAPAQLALMFSLLAADRQPADMMRAALPSSSSKDPPAAASAADAAEAARAALAAAADALPPAAVLRPVWDDAARAYVPPAALLADGAFGQLARAPVSREPALGAETCAAPRNSSARNSDARNSAQFFESVACPLAGTRCSPRAAASGAR